MNNINKKIVSLAAGIGAVATPFTTVATAVSASAVPIQPVQQAAVVPNITAVPQKTAYNNSVAVYKARVKAEALAKAALVKARKTPTKADDARALLLYNKAHAATVASIPVMNRAKAAWALAKTKVTGTFLGDLKNSNPYGGTRVQIVMTKGRITQATYPVYPTLHEESKIINDFFMPTMVKETLAAQSANIALVSGASLTFPDYKNSLQSALLKAGMV